ncbi:hypothetical protein Gotur_004215 [Gossypium turneri]
MIKDKKEAKRELFGKIYGGLGTNAPNDQIEMKRVENTEDKSESITQHEKRAMKICRDGTGKIKARRKIVRGSNGELTEESPSRMVQRKLLDRLTPSKTAAGEQPRQD